MIGWIYVASVSNAAGFLKISQSIQEPDEHIQEWAYDTGAPGIAHVEYAAIVEDAGKVEREIHRQLSHCRERGGGPWTRASGCGYELRELRWPTPGDRS